METINVPANLKKYISAYDNYFSLKAQYENQFYDKKKKIVNDKELFENKLEKLKK